MVQDLDTLERSLAYAERKLERDIGHAKALVEQHRTAAAQVSTLTAQATALEEAAHVLNSFSDARQATVRRKIESLVTHGLRAVLGDDGISFHLVEEIRANRSEIRFVIRTTHNGEVLETGIMEARGGGLAAVAGFLLRLVIVLLKPNTRPFLVLDESFGQLSANYEPALSQWMRELVDSTPVQLVLVTHSDAFSDEADKLYRFSLDKAGTTVVETLK